LRAILHLSHGLAAAGENRFLFFAGVLKIRKGKMAGP